MSYTDELSDSYRTLPYGITDNATDADRKRNVHDYYRFEVYPAYPWKFDKEIDRTQEDPRRFCIAAKSAGMMKSRRAEDRKGYEERITYAEWLRRNQSKPGFRNHLEELLNGKRQTSED